MDTKIWDSIIKDIHAHIDLNDCLNTSIEKVADLLDAERGSLMLLDAENQELSIRAARGVSEDIIKHTKVKLGEGISGWVAKNKEPLLIEDISKDKRFQPKHNSYHNNSLLSVPLMVRDGLLGVINLNNKSTKKVFNKKDLDVLKDTSVHISTAIDKALKYQEARRLSQLKMDFMSIASHELRTPLMCIKESISFLLDGLAGKINPEQKRLITFLDSNVDRAVSFIEDILNISKMEASRFNMRRSFSDICAVTKWVYEKLRVDANKKNIELKLEIPNRTIYMWFDSDQIARVLTDLVGDAIKFTENNGMVNIKLEDRHRLAQISIADNGPNIAEEDLGKVFDKYYSGLRSKLRGVRNTGLGLPVVKDIVELHRGRIWVDNETGGGVKFSFTLPKDVRAI